MYGYTLGACLSMNGVYLNSLLSQLHRRCVINTNFQACHCAYLSVIHYMEKYPSEQNSTTKTHIWLYCTA